MHLNLPWYLPIGLLLAWAGGRTALQMRHEKRSWGDLVLLLSLTLLPLAIWIFVQFFPQEYP